MSSKNQAIYLVKHSHSAVNIAKPSVNYTNNSFHLAKKVL
jgi:hypothetical protein